MATQSPTKTRAPGPPSSRLQLAKAAITQLLGIAPANHDFLAEQAKAYGDVVELRDPAKLFLVSDPDLVHQIFTTDGRITLRGRGHHFLRAMLGNGLVTAEGEEHRRNRRLVAPVFAQRHMAKYADLMATIIADLETDWQRRASQGSAEVDMAAEMSGLTLRIAGQTLMGTDLSAHKDDVARAITDGFRSLEHFRSPIAPLLLHGPTPIARRLRRSARVLTQVVDEVVAQHEAHPDRYQGDVVSLLLAARDEDGSRLSHQQVRDEVATLLVAGHETTANLLSWAWYNLDANPGAASLLHAELDGLGRAPGPTDAFEPALPVTRAVIAETLRYHPPVWAVGRRYVADSRLGEYAVAPGDGALVSQWVVHRDPRFWGEAAGNFLPQRWLGAPAELGPQSGQQPGCPFDTKAPGHPRNAYFPFGGGRRVCIGEGFAWAEAILCLATLARNWTATVKPGWLVDESPQITLRPKGGLPMTLVPRV